MRLHAQLDPGAAFHPLTLRKVLRVDVVVGNVVVHQVVFVVEPAAARQFLLRRVDGNIAPARALEQRDVFGLAARSRVRERLKSAGANLGDEVAGLRQQGPHLAAQVVQVEIERLGNVLVEGGLRAAHHAGVNRHRHQHVVGHALFKLERVDPDKRHGKRRLERVSAGEQPQLALLFFRCRLEPQRAVADQHQRGHAFRRLGNEDLALRQAQREIDGGQHQVMRRVLFIRLQ